MKSHKKKVINKDVKELKSCNCRVISECPLNDQCQVTDIICKYQTNQILVAVYLKTVDKELRAASLLSSIFTSEDLLIYTFPSND